MIYHVCQKDWLKSTGAKAACKMLVKLRPGLQQRREQEVLPGRPHHRELVPSPTCLRWEEAARGATGNSWKEG